MKKLLSIILLITSILLLSCNHNKLNSSLTSSIGKVGEITVNPLAVTPLSAVYTTETVNATPITVTVKGLYGEPDIIHTYPAGYGTEFEIHGMFAESQNTIEVNDGGRIITKNVSTESLPNGIQKKYDVAVNNLPEDKYKNNPEFYLLGNGQVKDPTLCLSRNGYVRYLQSGHMFVKIVIENKKIVLHAQGFDTSHTLLGYTILKKTSISHHDIIKINNDYLYFTFSDWGDQDRLLKMNSSGVKLREFSFCKLIENVLDLNKYPEDESVFKYIAFGEDINNIYQNNNGQQQIIDWFHANSLVYDSSTDILYVSSRTRGILAIDYSEWKLIWWMADDSLKTRTGIGPNNGIPYQVYFKDLKSLEPYRVKGAGLYDGPKNQHALFLLENGNLGMFDNQGDEDTNPNGSRYVEYKITGTHGNYTAENVYEYRDSSLYSRFMSDIDFTGDNHQNLLLVYANIGTILEVEKNTRNVLFRLDLPFQTYRVEKMPLYYDEGRVYSEDCNLKNPN
ncbi:aryl-sulfate sulfotransferase [Brachyspira innocens]|uniref:aryl-sulfate sulfotransferase n=1 Tax=Brachyspira innocens TaxID=13264 RepID=UPI00037CA833|nr:aryl-sulfate sulfotransferase [Brachyspira innocens]